MGRRPGEAFTQPNPTPPQAHKGTYTQARQHLPPASAIAGSGPVNSPAGLVTGHPGTAAQSGPAGKAARTVGWRPGEALTPPPTPPTPPFVSMVCVLCLRSHIWGVGVWWVAGGVGCWAGLGESSSVRLVWGSVAWWVMGGVVGGVW